VEQIQQKVEYLAPTQHPPPPDGVWEALWPAIHSLMTPALIGAFVLTIAATHILKQIVPVTFPHVTASENIWRAFCATASMLIGAMAGTVVWLASNAEWLAIPLVAFGTGLVWRIMIALLPARISAALMTDEDRRWKQEELGG